MIDTPTLFILGAGASKPYGYPTGKELRNILIRESSNYLNQFLNNDGFLSPSEKSKVLRNNREFVEAFRRSNIESIDKFLSFNPSLESYGKIAITLCILNAEINSLGTINAKLIQDWYELLFNRMVSSFNEPNDFRKFKDNPVSFITFNYDRSFEYMLLDSFCNSFFDKKSEFGMNNDNTYPNNLIPFEIIHVYGQVDKLQQQGGSPYGRAFESYSSFEKLQEISKGIRVIGERHENEYEKTFELFNKNKRIFFLGFGYAEENLKAINIPESLTKDHILYGTGFGMTEKEIGNSKLFLSRRRMNRQLVTGSVRLKNMNCYELLREYL